MTADTAMTTFDGVTRPDPGDVQSNSASSSLASKPGPPLGPLTTPRSPPTETRKAASGTILTTKSLDEQGSPAKAARTSGKVVSAADLLKVINKDRKNHKGPKVDEEGPHRWHKHLTWTSGEGQRLQAPAQDEPSAHHGIHPKCAICGWDLQDSGTEAHGACEAMWKASHMSWDPPRTPHDDKKKTPPQADYPPCLLRPLTPPMESLGQVPREGIRHR